MTRLHLLKPLMLLFVICQSGQANDYDKCSPFAVSPYVDSSRFYAISNFDFDSLSKKQTKHFFVKSDFTSEPVVGAILKLSDPLRHGVVFSFESDSLGQFQFDIQASQDYFLRIEKDGFADFEMKMASAQLAELKTLTLIKQIQRKFAIFASTNNQLLQTVSFDVISPIETHLCWLHPRELDKIQIAGISHIIYTPFKVLTFLSF